RLPRVSDGLEYVVPGLRPVDRIPAGGDAFLPARDLSREAARTRLRGQGCDVIRAGAQACKWEIRHVGGYGSPAFIAARCARPIRPVLSFRSNIAAFPDRA